METKDCAAGNGVICSPTRPFVLPVSVVFRADWYNFAFYVRRAKKLNIANLKPGISLVFQFRGQLVVVIRRFVGSLPFNVK